MSYCNLGMFTVVMLTLYVTSDDQSITVLFLCSMVHASCNMLSITVQQDVTIYSLFISANCSTCFRWYFHTSSGAHITVSTVSIIIETAKDKITSKCLCYITCY